MHFNMLASHWIGSGTVDYRVHRLHGRWGAWTAADADVAPDGGTGRWHDGNLDWTGAADRVQFRTAATVSRGCARTSSGHGSRTAPVAASERRRARRRSSRVRRWGADEEIVRAKPLLRAALQLAVVHHTAGTNTYTRAQSAAIVRGIEVYHVQGNGWNDIGYNFLVDRYGTVFEGRGGGIDRNVIGAHAQGFNTGTVGIALIGNYSPAAPPKAQQDALVALARVAARHRARRPALDVVYTSGGNAKFQAGHGRDLRAISGPSRHRPERVPRTAAYRCSPAIAKRVARDGPAEALLADGLGALGGPVRFQARLSSALPWTVTVLDQTGQPSRRAAASGRGRLDLGRVTGGDGPLHVDDQLPGVLAATGTLGIGRRAAATGALAHQPRRSCRA